MAAISTCTNCGKLSRGRKDKLYCSAKCRFEHWSLGAAVNPCYYCGVPADSVDHVPPQCQRPILESLGLKGRYEWVQVWACRECNSLLGARAIFTVRERKKFIKGALRRRYRKYLRIPEWHHSELAELGPTAKSYVISGIVTKELVEKRINW